MKPAAESNPDPASDTLHEDAEGFPPLLARVEALLSQMTLEEKIGQLTQVSGNQAQTGPLSLASTTAAGARWPSGAPSTAAPSHTAAAMCSERINTESQRSASESRAKRGMA